MTPEEHQLLVDQLRRSAARGTHLEIGTGAGGTLCIMLSVFTEEERPQFVVVDTMRYFPNQLELVKENLRRHGVDENTVDIRVGQSDIAFIDAEMAQERFDFVLIDGSHKVRAVMADLRWSRLINVNGLMCLHDYSSRYLGVRMAVNHFLRRNRNYQRLAQAGSLLVLRKVAPSTGLEVTRVDDYYASALHLLFKLVTSFRRKRRL